MISSPTGPAAPHEAKEAHAADLRNCEDGGTDSIATWDGPQDPQNPLNWDKKLKWVNVTLISSQAMLSPISSTILAVGSQKIAEDFHLMSIYTPNLPVSMFVLGLGLGPLYLAPLSELHGRRIVYLASFSLFTALNVGCALAPNITALSILRLLSGACGSAAPTLGGASIGDMFQRKDRGKALALYALGPTTGPVIGPLIGAFIVNGTQGWRWLMWIMVIAPTITVAFSFYFLRETYAPILLLQKARRFQEASGTHNARSVKRNIRARDLFSRAIIRPFHLLFFSPICTLMSIYVAFIYGVLYIHLVTIPLLFGPEPLYGLFSYRWQNGLTGLAYLGPGLGVAIGTVICMKYLNSSYAYMAKRRLRKIGSNEPLPESRMLFLQVGMILVPAGLIVFAWSAQLQTHWAIPLLGAAVFSIGMLMAYVCIQIYLVDVYETFSASALAASIFTRCVTSCIFCIVGFQLYASLGYAWGTMLLVFICILMLPIPLLLYKYGPRLRTNVTNEKDLNVGHTHP